MERDKQKSMRPISDVITDVRNPHKMALAPKKKRPYIKWVVLAFVLTLVFVAGGFYWQTNKDKNRTFHNQGISFRCPKTFSEQASNSAPGIIMIAHLAQSKPETTITAEEEKDADKSAAAAHRKVLDELELNASRSFPLRYPNFQKDGDNRIKIDSFEAADFSFHYTGQDKITTVYAHLLIVPRGHDAYYVITESVDQKDLNSVNSQIKNSLKLP